MVIFPNVIFHVRFCRFISFTVTIFFLPSLFILLFHCSFVLFLSHVFFIFIFLFPASQTPSLIQERVAECEASTENEAQDWSDSDSSNILDRMAALKPIALPQEFITWMGEKKGLQPPTVLLYRHALVQLLKFARLRNPKYSPSLDAVWNDRLCSDFFKLVAPQYAASTVPNFHNAMQAARKYLFLADKDPRNSLKLQEGFNMMSRAAQRKKMKYIQTEKMRLRDAPNTLKLFYQNFYRGEIWKKFFKIVNRVKKKKCKVYRSDLMLCNSILISAITACNFKRSSDFSSIPYAQAFKEISKAVTEFRLRFPNASMKEMTGPLNRKICVPAVLMVEECSKKGYADHVVLLHPRDLLAMNMYAKHIRPNGPKAPKTDRFFVNARGRQLSTNVSSCMRLISNMTQIPDLSLTKLRRFAETENLRDSSEDEVPENARIQGDVQKATAHIGHTPKSAYTYYKINDSRSVVRAANRLLFVLERAGDALVSI